MSGAPRLIFAGTPEFAAGHLRSLVEAQSGEIVAVFTQPDRPAGRGKKLAMSPVKTCALANGLPVFQPLSLREAAVQQQIRDLRADLMIVVAYGLILPQAVLDAPRAGCINVHASLLPRWRGAAPIQRAIEAGDCLSGVTIMQMDAGLDTGDILMMRECPVDPGETGGSLHDKLLALGCPALVEAVGQIAAGHLTRTPQDSVLSCYAPKITKAEAALDWNCPAELLERRVRAFNPFPVAYCRAGVEAIRIWEARAEPRSSPASPGTILEVGKAGIVVAAGAGALRLLNLQMPGKKPLAAAEILNGHGHPFAPGAVLA